MIFRCDGGWTIPPAFHGNPYTAGGDGNHMHFIWEKLFILVPQNGQYIPRLATKYRFSLDRKKLFITLRKGIKWHDGKAFQAKDIQTTFLIKYAQGWPESLISIETPEAHTVVMHWSKPISEIDQKIIFNEKIMAPYHLYGEFCKPIKNIITKVQKRFAGKKN